jgi:hypothetical protein
MVRIRQRWSMVLVGLVAVGFGMGLGACKKDGAGGADDKASAGAAGGGDLALLPADSEVVFGVNLGQLQQSGIWKQFVEPKLATGKGQHAMEEFKARCGADPLKMVSSITVGAKDFTSDKPTMVAIGHGVDKAKILDCLEKSKAEITKDGSEMTREGDVVLFKDKRGEPGAMMFTNDSTALLVVGANGTAAGVKAVASGGTSLKSSAPFVDMYKKVKTADSIWGLASGKVMDGLPVEPKPTAAYGSFNVTDGLTLDLRFRFAKPEDATQAATVANAQAKQATQFVDKAEVTAEGNELHAAVTLSGQKLAQLVPMLSMFMPGMGGN